jgi:hypothetical protein
MSHTSTHRNRHRHRHMLSLTLSFSLSCYLILQQPATAAGGGDVGASILVELVTKAVILLRNYRTAGALEVDDNPVILPLLEFVSLFSSNHLERCLCNASSGFASNVSAFLREFAMLSTASTDPQVWASLITRVMPAYHTHEDVCNFEIYACS